MKGRLLRLILRLYCIVDAVEVVRFVDFIPLSQDFVLPAPLSVEQNFPPMKGKVDLPKAKTEGCKYYIFT